MAEGSNKSALEFTFEDVDESALSRSYERPGGISGPIVKGFMESGKDRAVVRPRGEKHLNDERFAEKTANSASTYARKHNYPVKVSRRGKDLVLFRTDRGAAAKASTTNGSAVTESEGVTTTSTSPGGNGATKSVAVPTVSR